MLKPFLIAVDEAGYGPKIGPLVVAATLWTSRSGADDGRGDGSNDDPGNDFCELQTSVIVGRNRVAVDDSKKVFKSGDSLAKLLAILSIAHRCAGRFEPDVPTRLVSWLHEDDVAAMKRSPWLSSLFCSSQWPAAIASSWFESTETAGAVALWSTCRWKLEDIAARLIDARRFNDFCDPTGPGPRKGNKSDLLTETSLSLAADCLRRSALKDLRRGHLYFDRHGGRRFYAGAIANALQGSSIRVVVESPNQSVYDVVTDRGCQLKVHFTVKGDRFAPVALASLHAKYLREISMSALNGHFRRLFEQAGEAKGRPFRPTAGYPADADRFLDDMRPLLEKQSFDWTTLIRCR